MKNVIIIAEAGVNHNGDINTAKKLIDVASEAGVDFIKFQTFITELNISKTAKKADYQINNTKRENESQYEMVKKLELTENDHIELMKYCKLKDVAFLSTGFDLPSLKFLNELDIPLFKIPSGEITNYPYLCKIASFGKPVVMSTGMANLQEIKDALKVLTTHGAAKKQVTVVHCNTEYPTPMADVNLKAMNTIAEELGVEVGYSDHTLGIEVPIAAVARGAKVIEKHFTLSRELPGPDHRASLEPNELKAMVTAIRNIEKSISGNGLKEPSKSEQKNIPIARKSIHLAKNVAKGQTIKEEDLIPLRPGNGISPMQWNTLIGKTANTNLKTGEMLNLKDLQ